MYDARKGSDEMWRLPDEVLSLLEEVYRSGKDGERSPMLKRELVVALSIGNAVEDKIAVSGEESYEAYEGRITREWELAHKSNSLAELGILLAMAECIPGGSVDYPLSALQGGAGNSQADACLVNISSRLREAFQRLQPSPDGPADNEERLHNSKYSLNEPSPAESEQAVREASYGRITEFYGGLIDRIGLPQPNLYRGMENEHCRAEDSEEEFVTGNYHIKTTPKEEWLAVTDVRRRQELSDGQRVVRDVEQLVRAEAAVEAGLMKEEILALLLYTGES
eukprot:768693-Hanusia_phi.AAC.3